jgi:hypothetical protein
MRVEKGFFCRAKFAFLPEGEEVWFGPSPLENLTTNGLKLFPAQADTQAALNKLSLRQGLTESGLGYMEIHIAETEIDRESIRHGNRVVILHTTELGTDLLGPNLSDNPRSTIYPIEAERLVVNGGVPYPSYPDWIYRETSWQGGKVNLAALVDLRKINL